MLRKLYIRNYAIIDELEVRFSENMNVITGETGAGKSIIIGALGLILGQRADTGVLLNRDGKCIIEGLFQPADRSATDAFLHDHELDTGAELVIRREISATGKSRAFVNDTPVNLNLLQELSVLLADLHQQFDTLELAEADFQRQVLDALAGQQPEVQEYVQLFRQWQEARRQWEELLEQKNQFENEADYNQFQYDELAAAGFKHDELEEAEATLKSMSHAEEIRNVLGSIVDELNGGETPVVQRLKTLCNQLQPFADVQPELPVLLERLQSVQIELRDIADDAERISGHVRHDPARMDELQERLSLGYRLQKKHGVQDTAGLLAVQNQLEEKLRSVLEIDEELQRLQAKTEVLLSSARQQAGRISAARTKTAPVLEKQVNALLKHVGMPNAILRVEVTAGKLNAWGQDQVSFLFDANNSGQLQPLKKVASGGELSRLMLCIKSLVAESVNLPTLVFDEIDTGISGEAARQVGLIMKQLSVNRQVITITHQPQIAGQSDAHYYVYKETKNKITRTGVRLLTVDERIQVIARMLSGEQPTPAALENARELVSR